MNLACFPVQYQETYYKDVVEKHDEGLCKFAYWNGFVVGAACSRIEDIPQQDDKEAKKDKDGDTTMTTATDNNTNNSAKSSPSKSNSKNTNKRIYIMTLGVLAAYRGRQIGTQLIQSIFDHYESHKENEYKDVTEMVLHVQISNDDAIKFYTTRFGFEKGEMVENYYRRIDPPHCYKLYKKLR